MQPRTGTGGESRKGQCGVVQPGTTAWWRRKSQARQRNRDVDWGRMWHRLLLVSLSSGPGALCQPSEGGRSPGKAGTLSVAQEPVLRCLSLTLGFGLPWSCSFLTQCPQLPTLAHPGLGLALGDWASPSGPHSPGEIPPNSVIREKMVCARWCIEQGQREDGTMRPGAVWDTS